MTHLIDCFRAYIFDFLPGEGMNSEVFWSWIG